MNHERYKSQKALEYASETMAMIEKLSVDPNPIHYLVVYEAIAKVEPNLANKISKNLQAANYDDELASEFFNHVIKSTCFDVLVNGDFEELIDSLSSSIENWMEHFVDDQKTIDEVMGELESMNLPGKVHNLIHGKLKAVLEDQKQETSQLLATIEQTEKAFQKLSEEINQIKEISLKDELTGLLNRRGLNQSLPELIEWAHESQSSFSLVLIDIDHFKKLNDNFGHLVGDSALRWIARYLMTETKGKDKVARIGGEEFVILLADSSYSEAMAFSNHLRQGLEARKLKIKKTNQTMGLTVSVGVACYQLGEDYDELFDRADKALYLAKQNGRNRVVGEASI